MSVGYYIGGEKRIYIIGRRTGVAGVALTEPVILLVVIVVDVGPHTSNFLPDIVVLFRPLVRNLDRVDRGIRLGTSYHETIALLSPRLPNPRNSIVVLLCCVD
jgi:hypothetical protein